MNVSKGDLAITVGMDRPEFNGMIVEVIEFLSNQRSPAWWVKLRHEVLTEHGFKTDRPWTWDHCLRRICPPADHLIPDPIETPITEPA